MCGFTDYRGTVRKCDDGVGVGGGTVWRDDVIDARESESAQGRDGWREAEGAMERDKEAFKY